MLPGVMDPTAVRWLFFTLTAWLHQREADAVAYLKAQIIKETLIEQGWVESEQTETPD